MGAKRPLVESTFYLSAKIRKNFRISIIKTIFYHYCHWMNLLGSFILLLITWYSARLYILLHFTQCTAYFYAMHCVKCRSAKIAKISGGTKIILSFLFQIVSPHKKLIDILIDSEPQSSRLRLTVHLIIRSYLQKPLIF